MAASHNAHGASPHIPRRYATFHAYFLLIFLVLFPKGGIKAVGTPLTWGYLFLLCSTPLVALVRLLRKPLRVPATTIAVVAMLVPMQILLLYALLSNGYGNTGYAISMVAAVSGLPWIFLLVYPSYFFLIDAERLSKLFRFCVLTAALWGIFLFFLHPFYGHYIEIPYLTVNAADYGLLESTKYNARGFYLKLISTYNNGNLYGVATLILLPLYNTLERSRWKRGVVLSAVLLTLSRTVWVGLMVMETIPVMVTLLRQVRTFPVLYLGAAGKRTLALIGMVGLVVFVLLFTTNSGISFLLDPNLGGRRGELEFGHLSFLPLGGLTGFDESVYGSAANYYGLTGLLSMCLILFSPLLILLGDLSALRSPLRMAAFRGLMLYAVVSVSDGAFVLIPVMAFYWFAYTVFLHGWPGTQKDGHPAIAVHPAKVTNPTLLLDPS